MTKSRGAASGNIHKKCSKKFFLRKMSPKKKEVEGVCHAGWLQNFKHFSCVQLK